MNRSNIKVDPLTIPEIRNLIDLVKKAINEGNAILNLFDFFLNMKTETPISTASSDVPISPNVMFLLSPVKPVRKNIYPINDGSTVKFNNTTILSLMKYSLLTKFQKLFVPINKVYEIVDFEMNSVIDKFLECLLIISSMSIIIEDNLVGTESVNGKAKITVKGKKYIMDIIFQVRLYLIKILTDLKFNATEEILYNYQTDSLHHIFKSKQKGKINKIHYINDIINKELSDYPQKKITGDNDLVLKGFLHKKRENEKFKGGWKKKCFILTHRALMYSDKEIVVGSTMGKFLMFCDYDCIERVSEEVAKKKYCMRLFSHQDPKQSILLAANSEIEEVLWFNQIRDKMYINTSFFIQKEGIKEKEKENENGNESEKYRNYTKDELSEILKYINLEEKVKTKIITYVFLKKMDEIVKSAPNNDSKPINLYIPKDKKDLLVKLEKLRNENMDSFLSITTNNKQEDFMINLIHKTNTNY